MKRKDKVLLYHQIIHTVYWTAQCLPSASPHQWNLQNRGGKRKKKGEDMMQYMSPLNFVKIAYISKLDISITHCTHQCNLNTLQHH